LELWDCLLPRGRTLAGFAVASEVVPKARIFGLLGVDVSVDPALLSDRPAIKRRMLDG
jgi:hypothetical protein